jgi:stage II sporulation protein M
LSDINSGLALKNSLIINYLFIVGIFILGFSIFGIIIGVFMVYLKGFLFGFSLSSIFLTYKYKGILFGVLYSFCGSVLNILLVILISIYSIMFSKYLIKVITSRKSVNNRVMLKKYLIIFLGCIVFSFVSSLLEVYLFPYLLGLVRGLYV